MEKNLNDKKVSNFLDNLKPKEIAENQTIKEQFIKTLVKIHRIDEPEAESIYDREALYYKKALLANNYLQNCTNISLYSAFLEIAITGLSIQPGSKSEAYLESRGANSGIKDEKGDIIWINSATLQVTAYGELNMRIRSGQIVRMSNPIVLYDGDTFQPHTNERGELVISYKPAIPRRSNKIIGCYVAIYLPNNGLDFKWLLQEDIDRLSKASIPKTGSSDKKKPSALYSSNGGQIDAGFLEAKTIKHAMRAYTKLRVGESVSFEEDIPNMEDEETAFTEPSNVRHEESTVTFNDTNNDEEDIF
jgi:recombinational DNA repair protein RecT